MQYIIVLHIMLRYF